MAAGPGGTGTGFCHREALDAEAFGAVLVVEDGFSDPVVADQRGNACESDFESHGLRGLWGEEAGLHTGAWAWVGVQGDRDDSGGSWVGLEVELKEFEEEVAIVERERGFESAGVDGAGEGIGLRFGDQAGWMWVWALLHGG